MHSFIISFTYTCFITLIRLLARTFFNLQELLFLILYLASVHRFLVWLRSGLSPDYSRTLTWFLRKNSTKLSIGDNGYLIAKASCICEYACAFSAYASTAQRIGNRSFSFHKAKTNSSNTIFRNRVPNHLPRRVFHRKN